MAVSPHRFSALDGIRGVAALAVLLFHCGLSCDRPWMVGHGALAVDVFFAMSGFVVDRAYGARLRAGWPRRAFATARLVRLYPLYLVGILLGLALQCAQFAWQGRPVPAGGLAMVMLAGALLIPLVRGGDRQVFPLDPPCWSLLVEALMNVGFAAAATRWRPGLTGMVVAGAALVLAAAAQGRVPLLQGGTSEHLWVDVARGAFGFGCGVLISHAEARGRLPRLRARTAAPVLLALLGAMLLPRGPADPWLDPPAILLLCPAVVALAVSWEPSSARLRGCCARAGALSYPLYMLHAPLLKLAAELTPPAGEQLAAPRVLAVLGAAGLSVALAAAVGRWLEPALLRTSRNVAVGSTALRPPPALAAEGSD